MRAGAGRREIVLSSLALAASLLFFVALLRTRAVAVDESEFVAATVRVRAGLVPYRDFWEHHLPLQWFLLAPWARLGDPPSTDDVVRLRGFQALLWGAFGLSAVALLRRRGVPLAAALATLALLGSTSLFSVFAAEYRIDTPMNVFFFVGLLLAERSLDEEGAAAASTACGAGVAFALASLCSQRMLPTALAALALYTCARSDRRWGFRPAFGAAWAGAGAAALLVAAGYAAWGGLDELLQQNLVENAAYERLAAAEGQGRHAPWWPLSLAAEQVDAGLFVLLGLSGLALLGVFRGHVPSRCPARLLALALVQAALLSSIRSPNPYHLETALALLSLLGGLALGTAASRGSRLAVPVAAVAAAACAALAWSRTDRRIQADMTRFQDHVLATLTRESRADETVLDGCGLAWNRRSAFDVWFLRPIAIALTQHGVLRPLDAETLRRRRPAVVVADYALVEYLRQLPQAAGFVVRNYLPLTRVVWVPAPNGRLSPGESATWKVLRAGTYRVCADPRLAGHPWFTMPLLFPVLGASRPDAAALDLSSVLRDPLLRLSVDGRDEATPSVPLSLAAGQTLVATNRGGRPLGVFVHPAAAKALFRDPYPSVPLWATTKQR